MFTERGRLKPGWQHNSSTSRCAPNIVAATGSVPEDRCYVRLLEQIPKKKNKPFPHVFLKSTGGEIRF